MFQNMTAIQFLQQGGVVLLILSICSVISISVIIERLFVYITMTRGIKTFTPKLLLKLKNFQIDEALVLCDQEDTAFAEMLSAGIKRKGRSKDMIEDAMQRTSLRLFRALEKRLAILASLGATTPFIGLLGTVIGIIKTFQALSFTDAYSPGVVSAGIAEALLNTAAGLFVAIPAVIAYNYFTHKNQVVLREVEAISSEVIELVME